MYYQILALSNRIFNAMSSFFEFDMTKKENRRPSPGYGHRRNMVYGFMDMQNDKDESNKQKLNQKHKRRINI